MGSQLVAVSAKNKSPWVEHRPSIEHVGPCSLGCLINDEDIHLKAPSHLLAGDLEEITAHCSRHAYKYLDDLTQFCVDRPLLLLPSSRHIGVFGLGSVISILLLPGGVLGDGFKGQSFEDRGQGTCL
jgi:hypothetical protein